MLMDRIHREMEGEALCALGHKWGISNEILSRIACMAQRLPFGISILSGYRTKETQQDLIREGKGAPDHLSNHRVCPARAADLWPDVTPTRVVQATFGEAAVACGLRWGGGSPVDPDTGIPSDWNHVDLGPRSGASW